MLVCGCGCVGVWVCWCVGVGPNIITTSGFNETSLDNGVTQPDNIFSGNTDAVLSATVGAGIQFNNVFAHAPLNISYRFFYLGEGHLARANNQVLDSLSTGDNYASALVISTTF